MAFANKEKEIAYVKNWQKNHREKMRATQKKYYLANKSKIRIYKRERVNNNIQTRLAANLRCRLYLAIKNKQKVGSAVKDLGCTISDLKTYLEKRFKQGMNWYNHKEWHIDHIVPLSLFNLVNREQFLIANHYTNLQPMWKIDNIKKSNSLNY